MPASPPQLTCYRVQPDAPDIVPARADRAWMDATHERFAYRCIPLSIANASGWEIVLPCSFEATYFGGNQVADLQLRSADGSDRYRRIAASHFGHGILTFHTGWLLRTSPGWALWARGSPNAHRDRIAPLDGVVETDWLPFPFTMNWRFTRPATVRFTKGEPFCFFTIVPHALIDKVEPRIATLDDDPALKAAFDRWSADRADFNARLSVRDPSAVAEGWQRTYVQGKGALGDRPPSAHLTKRRLKPPR